MQIFYLKTIKEKTAFLEGDEAKHCIKVLRHQIGDRLHCIDGKGVKYVGVITEIASKGR